MAQLGGRKQITHLLRRAGFGASPEEVEDYLSLGFERAVQRLVDYEGTPNTQLEARVEALEAELDLTRLPSVQTIWLTRMLHTQRPLEERMVLFWHDHFATANYKVRRPEAMYEQNKVFRAHAAGKLGPLLKAVARDPAMLRWLDGNANRRRSPNENFARELLELFTMGVGSYSEQDVREAARAFTGWFFDRNRGFVFNRNQHDSGPKTFLGRAGAWDGDDVIDIILQQPVTSEFLTRKLFAHFVHDHPSQATVNRFSSQLRASDYNLRELVRAILLSPEFSSDEAYHAVVKSPVELVVGSMKSLGISRLGQGALGSLRRMGMDLFNPPDVDGWEWNAGWIGSNTLLERLNGANALTATGRDPSTSLDAQGLLQALGASTAAEVVDGLASLLVDGDVTAQARERLLTSLLGGGTEPDEDLTPRPQELERVVRGAAHLIMAMPAYQMA